MIFNQICYSYEQIFQNLPKTNFNVAKIINIEITHCKIKIEIQIEIDTCNYKLLRTMFNQMCSGYQRSFQNMLEIALKNVMWH